MRQINRQILRRFWRVAQPYWVSREWRGATILLILLLLLSCGSSGIIVLETLQRGEVVSALASGKLERFWQALVFF